MKLYIKQKWNKYFIYAKNNEQPISEGYWKNKRKLGLHCKLFDVDKNEKLFIRIGKSDSKWWWIGPPRLYILEFPDQKILADVKLMNL